MDAGIQQAMGDSGLSFHPDGGLVQPGYYIESPIDPALQPTPEYDEVRREIANKCMLRMTECLLFFYGQRCRALGIDYTILSDDEVLALERIDPQATPAAILGVFMDRMEYLLEVYPELQQRRGVCLLGLCGAGKTTLCGEIAKQNSGIWTCGEVEEFSLVRMRTGISVLSGRSEPPVGDPSPFDRVLRGRIYSESRVQGHTMLSGVYSIIARNGGIPVVSGWIPQAFASIGAYCGYQSLPEMMYRYMKIMPWQPKFVYLYAPKTIRWARVMQQAAGDLDEWTRRAWAMRHEDALASHYAQIMSRFPELSRCATFVESYDEPWAIAQASMRYPATERVRRLMKEWLPAEMDGPGFLRDIVGNYGGLNAAEILSMVS